MRASALDVFGPKWMADFIGLVTTFFKQNTFLGWYLNLLTLIFGICTGIEAELFFIILEVISRSLSEP